MTWKTCPSSLSAIAAASRIGSSISPTPTLGPTCFIAWTWIRAGTATLSLPQAAITMALARILTLGASPLAAIAKTYLGDIAIAAIYAIATVV